eukprot:TRINITY_DN5304_c0_g1_i1.p1 TRINITY_DN5304_c0_g1~~TRINITY_DN5304_c0_g1_i1.p1  ORF type:complete len:804 (-),score=121.12 TRINITY_DN5304_c0_g1_i1:381-2792(-)
MTFSSGLSVRLGYSNPCPYPHRAGKHTLCRVVNTSYSNQQFSRVSLRRSYRLLVRSDKGESEDTKVVVEIEQQQNDNIVEKSEDLVIKEKDDAKNGLKNGNISQNSIQITQNGFLREAISLSKEDIKNIQNETSVVLNNSDQNLQNVAIEQLGLELKQNTPQNGYTLGVSDNEILNSQSLEIVQQEKSRKVQQRKPRLAKPKVAQNSIQTPDQECVKLEGQQDNKLQSLQQQSSSQSEVVKSNNEIQIMQDNSQVFEKVGSDLLPQTKETDTPDIPRNGHIVLDPVEQSSNNDKKEKNKRIRKTQKITSKETVEEKETGEESKESDEERKASEEENVRMLGQKEARNFFEEMDKFDEDVLQYVLTSMTGSKLSAKLPVRMVTGVGPKNEQLLKEAGCSFLWQLLFLFQFRFMCSEQEMEQYLRDVGVKKYKKTIIDFLKEQSLVRNAVITLEGNIGAGKTTFLKSLSKYARSKIKVIEEPVAEWQEVRNTAWIGRTNDGPEYFNLLNNFYTEPKQAFQFQTFVLGTKISNSAYASDPWHYDTLSSIKQSQNMQKDMVHLLERSVFADRLVFVRSLHEKKIMNDQEVSIYDQLFDRIVNYQSPNLYPDGFVYLRAEPKVCENRMKKRNRSEESKVTYQYLKGLHEMHEDWLHKYSLRDVSDENVKAILQRRRESRFLSNQDYQFIPDRSSNIELEMIRNLMYDTLDIAKIHSIPTVPECLLNSDLAKIQLIDPRQNQFVSKYPGLAGIPTLEVDWNQDWDIEGDTKKQEKIANIVESFVDWVSRYKALIRIPELLPVHYTYHGS